MSEKQRQTLLSASAQGATFLILLQLSSRMLTFIVNQILLRCLSPEMLGISVQLELFMITVLYFSRESLRTALQRYGASEAESKPGKGKKGKKSNELVEGTPAAVSQTAVNLSLLTLPLGIVFASALSFFYSRSFASSETASQPYFKESVGLYVLATLIELLSEPGFALAQQKMMYKLRAGAESAATFTRCVVTCGLTIYAAKIAKVDVGPLPFAVGQMGYAVVLLAVYRSKVWRIARDEGFGLGLRKIGSSTSTYHLSYFHKPLSSLALTMWIQSSIKHVLTQGDTILVTWLTTNHDQGVYALAANYGSLIARMLFQPLEESSRNLFAKLLSPSKSGAVDPSSLASSENILKILLKLYLLLSIFAAALGPPFAPIALNILAGSRWAQSNAGPVLANYCYYIPLLAINGITEAFVQSVATPRELQVQSLWMFSFSLGFGIAGYGFVKTLGWGAQGLVWANVVNMALRIIWSSVFIQRYFGRLGKKIDWTGVLPGVIFISVALPVGALARSAVERGAGMMKEIGAAGVLSVVLLAACAVSERRFFRECWGMLKSSRAK
ncbi:Oligosaccharide translocation protein rft1 [Rhizina undulata]